MVYSENDDRFIFCNKVSFARDDTASLAKQVIKKTNATAEEVKDKTSDELITDLKYVPCEFSRDELFSVVLIGDSELASELKQRNMNRNLTVADMNGIKEMDSDAVFAWYYYTN